MDTPLLSSDENELVDRIARSAGLPAAVARRVVEDVIAHYGETLGEYVRRRHRELAAAGIRNPAIYEKLRDEVGRRPFAAAPCSVRQIRRIIYG